jgi:hypothetical protein
LESAQQAPFFIPHDEKGLDLRTKADGQKMSVIFMSPVTFKSAMAEQICLFCLKTETLISLMHCLVSETPDLEKDFTTCNNLSFCTYPVDMPSAIIAEF